MGIVAKARGLHALHHVDVVVRRRRSSASSPTTQARNQSKLYAPQVAKHLKEGRLKDAIALSSSKNYRYSHLAKVVLAGLQEYQFQQESGGGLTPRRPDGHRAPLDSARVGADRLRPQEGRLGARDHRLDGPVRRTARHGRRRHQRVPGHRRERLGRYRRRLGRYFGSARRDRARSGRRDPGGVDLQLPDGRIEYFNVEMDNSSSELVDYFIKKTA